MRIPVRKMDFKFEENFPRYWYNNNPWITHWVHCLSAVFPDGERFFIDTVRHYRDKVSDPELKNEVKAFIGQEAHHGKEHEAFNEILERVHKIPATKIAESIKKSLDRHKKVLGPQGSLAITLALEHFTATFADWFLKHPEVARELGPHAKLFLWHAVEETEHKAVAFDVYKHIGGNEQLRKAIMAYMSFVFIGHQLAHTANLVRKDGKLTDVKAFKEFLEFLFGEPGMLAENYKPWKDYFNKKFHPWDHDNKYLIEEHVEKLKAYEVL
jgi:hypothetical protein